VLRYEAQHATKSRKKVVKITNLISDTMKAQGKHIR